MTNFIATEHRGRVDRKDSLVTLPGHMTTYRYLSDLN